MVQFTKFLRNQFAEHFGLEADAARALRGLVAFSVPLLIFHWRNDPADAIFISTAALNLSLPDLRGAYRIRLSILATMTLVAAGAAFLGVWSGGSIAGAVAAMGLLALLGGVWRQMNADYGPSLAVSSALLFLLGLAQKGGWREGLHLAGLVALGGAVATSLHACQWLIRPQQALRSAVAEAWVAASDLIAAMRPESSPDKKSRAENVAKAERELRATLDRTFVVLGAAKNRKQAALIAHLEGMRLEAVHLTMRVIALNTPLESLMEEASFARNIPVADSVLKSLADASRSVAAALILHRAESFEASNVRLRRCRHLIGALDGQIAAIPSGGAEENQVRAALGQILNVLPRIGEALGETSGHAVSRTGFSASLPDISARSLRSLTAWMGPVTRLDPVLARYSLRMAAFTMFAVGIYKAIPIPRGYWIAFTIMVVLQPDYGSTRQKAGQRIAGTLSGIALVAALLWLGLPQFLLEVLAAATAFAFAYFVKRRYGVAIFFVTINLVMISDMMAPVRMDFMLARALSILLGGALALVAARVFWPVWEGRKFPELLAAAVRANRVFLLSLSPGSGAAPAEATGRMMARRRAENANRYVAASLERLLGEPSGLRENTERASALATYNQRVTRSLIALSLQMPEPGALNEPSLSAIEIEIGEALESLAGVIENGRDEAARPVLMTRMAALETGFASAKFSAADVSNQSASPAHLTWVQLAKTIAEIRAMMLALDLSKPENG